MINQRSLMLALALLVAVSATNIAQEPAEQLPISNTPSYTQPPPLTYAQQTARFAAEQRMMRIQWNKWIGHEPLRPTMNASYMSNGVNLFYIPSRSVIVSSGTTRSWYW